MPPKPVVYDPKVGPLLTSIRFSGTVVPKVLRHPAIWVFSALNILIFVTYNTGLLSLDSWKMDPEGTKIIAGITTFFEVFYTNACYERSRRFWSLNKDMCGKILNAVLTIGVLTKDTGKPYARVVARWMVMSFMVSVSKGENVWTTLCDLDLCTTEEADCLSRHSSTGRILIISQAVASMGNTAIEEAKVGASAFNAYNKHVMEYLDLAEEVEELKNFPIPYEYFHLLNLMITVSLAVAAYSMGLSDSFFAPIFFWVQALIFMGMLDMASQLADPFGDDDADFPLHFWVKTLMENVSALVGDDLPGAEDKYGKELEREAERRTRFSLSLDECEQVLFGSSGTGASTPSPWDKDGKVTMRSVLDWCLLRRGNSIKQQERTMELSPSSNGKRYQPLVIVEGST